VAGTTLAFMAITYLLLPLIFQREVIWPRLAKVQPYLFALGVAGISLFMMGAGTLGVSRRHWDITFSGAPLAFDYPGAAFLMMGLNGMSAVLASIGGITFILIVVGSIFWGKKVSEAPAPKQARPGAVVGRYGSSESLAIPGTVVLVAIFFTAFVLYYFVNWKYLAEVWPLR
jgi:cytochrome c oxidase subunit 1